MSRSVRLYIRWMAAKCQQYGRGPYCPSHSTSAKQPKEPKKKCICYCKMVKAAEVGGGRMMFPPST